MEAARDVAHLVGWCEAWRLARWDDRRPKDDLRIIAHPTQSSRFRDACLVKPELPILVHLQQCDQARHAQGRDYARKGDDAHERSGDVEELAKPRRQDAFHLRRLGKDANLDDDTREEEDREGRGRCQRDVIVARIFERLRLQLEHEVEDAEEAGDHELHDRAFKPRR